MSGFRIRPIAPSSTFPWVIVRDSAIASAECPTVPENFNMGAAAPINLAVVNSSATTPADIMLFQKNLAAVETTAVVWRRVAGAVAADPRPVQFVADLFVAVVDSLSGLASVCRLPAGGARAFTVSFAAGSTVPVVAYAGPSGAGNTQTVTNSDAVRTVTARLWRGTHVVAFNPAVAPGQTALFRYGVTVFIGLAPAGVAEGDLLTAAQVTAVNTEISLLGLASATVDMTDGPSFSLQDVVAA
jgi:hypothetical protein